MIETTGGLPTSALLRDALEQLRRFRDFTEWCARLDQPDPQPSEEQARLRLEIRHVAETARAVLS
jgi:hypothetical protein